MADEELAELLKKQISLTEWLQGVDADYIDSFREEDTKKRKTLGEIAGIISWPVEHNVTFEASEVGGRSEIFNDFLKVNQENLYAMRLLPKATGLEKLRLRGVSLAELMIWFDGLDIAHEQYEVNLIDHPSDYKWATIFFVNRYGIHGEIIYGGHHLLTQGFHGGNTPIQFHFDFKKNQWQLSEINQSALAYLQKMIQYINITDKDKRKLLSKQYGATFQNNYLTGYFETTDSSLGTWFIDYNQTLGEKLSQVSFENLADKDTPQNEEILRGRSGSPGTASGKVRIIQNPDDDTFQAGEVLVCRFTSPDYIHCMKKASAIVTDEGGTLSHAAIIARELGVPCIVATSNATDKLIDGVHVEVDADNGIVRMQ